MLRLLPSLTFLLLALPLATQAEQTVVIGDSLTKEYEVEFPALFPQNPASWGSRNWIEILHQRRTDWFDTGPFAQNNDPRIVGHEYNWAFPGATAVEIKNQLNNSLNQFLWGYKLNNHIKNIAERVVIFAGGNDVDSYYLNIYNGAAPAAYTNTTRDSLQWIVDYVRSQKPGIPILLVSVPHLGCAPDIQLQAPTDPVKTARVTAALDALNAQLATFAQSRGIAFAPGVYELTKQMIDAPFRIGGIEFYKQGDMDARPRYLFSGDNFHPNTAAHARIAQFVIEAFRTRYGTNITPLGDREIVVNILGLDPNIPYNEWAASQSLPPGQTGFYHDPDNDGLKNILEFALDPASPPSVPTLEVNGQQAQLAWTFRLNPVAAEWARVKPQYSENLVEWLDVPPSSLTTVMDGSITARMPVSSRPLFYRLSVAP